MNRGPWEGTGLCKVKHKGLAWLHKAILQHSAGVFPLVGLPEQVPPVDHCSRKQTYTDDSLDDVSLVAGKCLGMDNVQSKSAGIELNMCCSFASAFHSLGKG